MDSCTGMSQYLFTLIYNPVLCYLLCSSATGSSFKLAPMSLWGFCFSVFFILFWLHHVACGLLVAWPGSKPTPLALEAQSLSHWATREVPSCVPLRCLHPFVFLSTTLLSDTSQYSRFSLCFPCPKGFPGDWDGSLPAMQETQVRSLSREEPLEKEMATHSSTLAWKVPWMEAPGRLQSMGSQSPTRLNDLTHSLIPESGLPWRLNGKESSCNAGDVGDAVSVLGSGRSPEGGNSNPLQ